MKTDVDDQYEPGVTDRGTTKNIERTKEIRLTAISKSKILTFAQAFSS